MEMNMGKFSEKLVELLELAKKKKTEDTAGKGSCAILPGRSGKRRI